jgi:uncharacterized protein (TIGR02453 family)
MKDNFEFNGFPRDALRFYKELTSNNNRDWFQENKSRYQDGVLKPAQAFVETLGERLKILSNGITYDSRTSGVGSILRIYRDIRFSKDKTPYKTHLGVIFWEGKHKKMENPGFYFQLDPSGAEFYSGFYRFSKPFLKAYREAVHDKQLGEEFESILSELNESDGYEWGGDRYKRVPSGYDKDHPRADLLLHKGLWGKAPSIPNSIVSSPELVDVCFENAVKMMPLHKWLVEVEKYFSG